MKPHVHIYLNYFDYGIDDVILCERCGSRSNDVHHVWGRGKGKNIISNLMALCRDCHDLAHKEKISKQELQRIHNMRL